MKKGIAVAGSLVADIVYTVDRYPEIGALTKIQDPIINNTGGAVCNTAMVLAKLDSQLPITALGKVGKDEAAERIWEAFRRYPNIDVSQIGAEGSTSFTLVIVDSASKQRSFFAYWGANEVFCEDDIDWDKFDAKIFHIGYILSLNALDEPDNQYGTKMARLLAHAKEHGLETSVDVVSEMSDRFQKIVPPSLKYTDYCIINEIEAQCTTGISLRENGELQRQNMKKALEKMNEMGVAKWAVIHCPECGFGLDCRTGEYVEVPSLKLPKGFIKNTTGAGDAYCTGVLYGAHEDRSLEDSMKLATASAAFSLSDNGAADGLKPEAEVIKFYQEMC